MRYEGYAITGNGAERARTWLATSNNITVKQETLDASDQVTSTTTLTKFE